MGEILSFTARTSKREPTTGVRPPAEILFFLGVRYERYETAEVASKKGRRTPSKTPPRGPRKQRA